MLRVFSFPVFLGALLVAGLMITVRLNFPSTLTDSSASPQISIFEGDTWWHLTMGERILQTHNWPMQETDSFTAHGGEWIDSEWLGEVAMALAERLGGVRGLAVLLVVLASTILVLTYYSAYLRTGGAEAAFLACVVLSPLMGVSFTLRPQLFGYIFLLLTLTLLERFRAGRQKRLWLLPLIFLLWVNTHPTFVYGYLLLALFLICGQLNFSVGGVRSQAWQPAERCHLLLVTLLSTLALPLNPYGGRLVAYLARVALDQPLILASLQEWRPLPFDEFYGKLFLVLLLGFLLAALTLRQVYRLEEFILLVSTAWLACMHLRFLILFAIIFAPLLAGLLVVWVPPHQSSQDRHLLNAVLMTLIAAGVVAFMPSRQTLDAVIARGFPVGAVEYLRADPLDQPMFNDYLWGGFLTRSLGTRHKVFIDGRADVYEPAGVLADYLHITRLDGDPLPLFRKYGVESCLITPGQPLATFLANSPGWRKIYADDLSVVFVHESRTSGPRGGERLESGTRGPDHE